MLSLSKHEAGGGVSVLFVLRQAQDEDRETRMGAFVYILRCRDGKYYVGSTRDALEKRVNEHNAGTFGGFTSSRRPVELAFSQYFDRITDAVSAERQLKGWSRAKKEALMRGDFENLKCLSQARTKCPHPSTSSG